MSKNLERNDIVKCCDGIVTILDDFDVAEDSNARVLVRHFLNDLTEDSAPRDVAAVILCYTYPRYGVLLEDLPPPCGEKISDYVRDFFAEHGIGAKRPRNDNDGEEEEEEEESFEPVMKEARNLIEAQFLVVEEDIETLERVVDMLKRKHDEAIMKYREAEECMKKCKEVIRHLEIEDLLDKFK